MEHLRLRRDVRKGIPNSLPDLSPYQRKRVNYHYNPLQEGTRYLKHGRLLVETFVDLSTASLNLGRTMDIACAIVESSNLGLQHLGVQFNGHYFPHQSIKLQKSSRSFQCFSSLLVLRKDTSLGKSGEYSIRHCSLTPKIRH